MGKAVDAVHLVASVAMSLPAGSRVPTTLELASGSGTAAGTIQAAIRRLESEGAIKTTSHGSFGRRLVEKDLVRLWSSTARGPLSGVLPIPDRREFVGLATSLSVVAEAFSLPLQLLFRQGNQTRLRLLDEQRVDFAVMSAQSASHSKFDTDFTLLEPNSYYPGESVVVITRKGEAVRPPRRVPVDRNSSDHERISRLEFPDAEPVDVAYTFIPELVVTGEFDAAVWHKSSASPLLVASGLELHPLRNPDNAPNNQTDRAAIVYRRGDLPVEELVSEFFEASKLEPFRIQVLEGSRIPQF